MNDMSKAETARRLVLQSIEPGEVRDDVLECIASMDAEMSRLRVEVERLYGWLEKIDGGDRPFTDAAMLRQWAYLGLTLRHEAPDDE